MIEGSDDRAREDELDLGHAAEEENGVKEAYKSQELVSHASMAYTEDDFPVVASSDQELAGNHISIDPGTPDASLSPGPGQPGDTPGSIDETASTPDDLPSLHVS